MKDNAELTIKTLEGCRGDTSFDLVWESAQLKCNQVKNFLEKETIDMDFKEPRMPRSVPENVTDLKSYQKVKSYYPSLDRVIMELKNRFSENDQIHLCSLGSLIFDDDPSEKDIKIAADFYSLDKDAISSDLPLFKHFKVNDIKLKF